MGIYGDRAVAAHGEGYNCCQCVVSSLCEYFGIDRTTAFRFAGAFGSGIGHLGETCGAVTGAVMLIGMKYGKTDPGQKPERVDGLPIGYARAQVFFGKFKEQFGALKCNDLLGADINTEQGKQALAAIDRHQKCDAFIRAAADIAAEMLKD